MPGRTLGSFAIASLVASAAVGGLFASPARSAASPSPKPSPSVSALIFSGPAGWRHLRGTSDGLGIWLHLGDTGYSQNITVEKKDGLGSLNALLQAEVSYISGLPDRFGYAPKDTTLCGGHPAKYLSYTYTSESGLPVTSEVVIAVFGKTAYSARYNKSISQNADSAAERSLLTLCGRAASH